MKKVIRTAGESRTHAFFMYIYDLVFGISLCMACAILKTNRISEWLSAIPHREEIDTDAPWSNEMRTRQFISYVMPQ